jgi:hypothetical protein
VLVYRTEVEAGAAILTVAVRPLPGSTGFGRPAAAYRVILRYALPDGCMRVRRGRLQTALPPGTILTVIAHHIDGTAAVVSLQPAGALRPGRGAAVSDRFRLPVSLQAWGVTLLSGADVGVDAVLRAGEGRLLVRGAVWLQLRTPAATLKLRVPFLRVLAADTTPGLRWRLCAGVSGLSLRVEPGGRIAGEVWVGWRAEGRPTAKPLEGAGLARIREVTATVAGAAAEHAGAGHAVLRGNVGIDLFGIDHRGRSRWTGRTVPFATLLDLAGALPDDRLEASAVLDRLTHTADEVRLLVTAHVLALRPVTIVAGDGLRYRVERVVAEGRETVALVEPIDRGAPVAPETGGGAGVTRQLPLPGPDAWSELTAALSGSAGARSGTGDWQLHATRSGPPAAEGAGPGQLRIAAGGSVLLGHGDGLAVVPALHRVDPAGVELTAHLLWGPPLAEPAAPVGLGETVVLLPTQHAVRRILLLSVTVNQAGGMAVEAVLGLAGGGGLRRVTSRTGTAGGRPVSALAYPVLHNGQWHVHVTITSATDQP